MDFSVITPSYNMLNYLKRCSASVKDQRNVLVEHLVFDGGSSDGTVEWLKTHYTDQFVSEPDTGMYDAINKGLLASSGDYIAYLNCDEQYLPDVLANVKRHFECHPEADIVFGNALVIEPDGGLIAYRKSHFPRSSYIFASYLYVLSCTLFLRRRVITDGFFFNTNYSAVADADYVIRLLKNGYGFTQLNEYLAAFTVTGSNKIKTRDSLAELKTFMMTSPKWVRLLKFPLNIARLFEKFLSGAYFQKFPLDYELFIDNDKQRQRFNVTNTSYRLKW